MRPRKALIVLGLSAVIGSMPYLKVGAYTCCDPWGQVGFMAFVQAGTTVVTSITTAVTSVSTYLMTSITPTVNNGFTRWADERNKTVVQKKLIEEGKIQASTQLYMEGKRAEATEQFMEAAMHDETVTNGLILTEQKDRDRTMRVSEGLALSDDLRPTRGAPDSILSRHSGFCGQRAFEAGLCAELAPSTLQNADINVNTILNPGDGQYDTLSDAEMEAGRAFVRNILSPTQPRDVAGDTAQAQQWTGIGLADQAALSLAGNSLNSVMMARVRKGGAAAGKAP